MCGLPGPQTQLRVPIHTRACESGPKKGGTPPPFQTSHHDPAQLPRPPPLPQHISRLTPASLASPAVVISFPHSLAPRVHESASPPPGSPPGIRFSCCEDAVFSVDPSLCLPPGSLPFSASFCPVPRGQRVALLPAGAREPGRQLPAGRKEVLTEQCSLHTLCPHAG